MMGYVEPMKQKYIDFNDDHVLDAIHEFDLIGYLDEVGADYVMEGKNLSSKFIGLNPCPNPLCGDTSNHFAIHKDKKYGTCFKCKCFYPLPFLIAKLSHVSLDSAMTLLLQNNGEDLDIVQRIRKIFKTRDKRKQQEDEDDNIIENLPKEVTKITKATLNKETNLKEFLKSRNIKTLAQVKKYNLHFLRKTNEIVFPIMKNNMVVSYQRRSIKKKQYIGSKTIGNYILNEEKIIPKKPLILVEGFFDAISFDIVIQKFFKEKISVTTCFAKLFSSRQAQKIIDCKPSEIFCVLDGDSWMDYIKIQNRFPFNVTPIMLPKKHDPNSLPLLYLKHIIETNIL